jgi:enoyl-CoA hydratase/carnithine racemase
VTDEFPVRVEQRGAVAVWTLDRADRMNALTRAMLFALGKLAREAATNESIRAIVLTGAGDKAFCAGADLKERRGMSDDDVRALIDLYRTELGPLDRCPKPVVAAINGVALGGGLELALTCDLRVAAPGAQLGLPETSIGVIPGAGGTQRLARVVGEARAKEMILLARRVTAEEALSWGLVNRVSPAGTSVVDDAVAWAAPIAQGAPVEGGRPRGRRRRLRRAPRDGPRAGEGGLRPDARHRGPTRGPRGLRREEATEVQGKVRDEGDLRAGDSGMRGSCVRRGECRRKPAEHSSAG